MGLGQKNLTMYNVHMEEFEVTYLPKYLPAQVSSASSKEMLDIYIPVSSAHPTLRIRKCGENYEVTKKQPVTEGDASHQFETTVPLTADEFADLEKLEGKRVTKTRYFYKENDTNYEIDVFQDNLKGLILVDVEFQSKKEKSNFKAPEWFLADVTQEDFIAGGMLCGKHYDDIREKLKTFGYSEADIK